MYWPMPFGAAHAAHVLKIRLAINRASGEQAFYRISVRQQYSPAGVLSGFLSVLGGQVFFSGDKKARTGAFAEQVRRGRRGQLLSE
jgi:hypothetical protein